MRIKSGYFNPDGLAQDAIYLAGIKCEIVYVEIQTSTASTKIEFGDKVGCETETGAPVVRQGGNSKSKGIPRTSDQIEKMKKTLEVKLSLKETEKPDKAAARREALLTRDLDGYEHIRTWGRKLVFEVSERPFGRREYEPKN